MQQEAFSCCSWLPVSQCQRRGGFPLARVMCRLSERCSCADREGTVLDNPPLPEEICGDPLLGALKLIAWSGDDALLPRSGARGFPHWGAWLQRNTRFSADLRPFAAGLPATASGMATRCVDPPSHLGRACFACRASLIIRPMLGTLLLLLLLVWAVSQRCCDAIAG